MPEQVAYQHDITKLPDAGLQLNLPPDLVPAGQYPYFSNALSRIEGQLQTREGLALVCTVGSVVTPVHSIFRLNQVVPTIFGERLFGVGTGMWTAPLPAGDVPTPLVQYIVGGASYPAFAVSFNGRPLSIIQFRFDNDPQAWAIIANGNRMMKRKANFYEQLGLPPPNVAVQASVGAAGFLTGDYAWQYTYVNVETNTESDPSPVTMTSPVEVTTPSGFAAPDPAIGGGVPAHFGPPTNTQASFNAGQGSGELLQSIIWSPWTAATQPYSALTLTVHVDITIGLPPGEAASATVEYSVDGGSTWQPVLNKSYFTPGLYEDGPYNFVINLPPSVNLLTQLQFRARGSISTLAAGPYGLFMVVSTIQANGTEAGTTTSFLSLTSESADLCVAPPVDPQETAIRLYRIGGTLTDAYTFVQQYNVASLVQGACGAGLLHINDNSSDTVIESNPTLQLDNDMPVSSVSALNVPLTAIWGADERVLGVGDPSRPESVYFSKRGNADAWPPQNWVVVSEPGTQMMNGLSWNLRYWAFSRERLYTLVPNVIQGETFTPQETGCRRGLKGQWAFCVGEKGIYFVSKDGMYLTSGGPEVSVADDTIRPLFPTFDAPGQDANGYEAIDMDDEDGLRLSRHNSEIWFDYTGNTTGTRQTLIYDERKNRWRGYHRGGLTTSSAQMHYSEPETVSRLLTGAFDNVVFQGASLPSDGGTSSILVHVRTGSRDQGQPLNLKEYGNVIFDIDPGAATVANPVVITPYINGAATPEAALKVTGSGRQRVALDLAQAIGQEVYALNIAFDITWTTNGGAIAPVLYQYDILYRVEPAAVQHWEVPPNSLGLSGFFHVRDAYVALRSSANVTMTVRFDDNTTQSYVLTSTGNSKAKLYVSFAAKKCKLVGFSFDSSADFRLYQAESELRAKAWVTDLGYQVAPLFGAENP